MTMRSIALVMSAYNEADYLEPAVKSVLAKLKEHDFDYEVLIFDDASTDNTGRIAERLACENPKIKVFHNSENKNLGYNISKGIQIASKTYCGLVPCNGLIAPESFDYILPSLGGVDLVVAYIANPGVRPLYRRAISKFNTLALNLLFGFGLKYYHFSFYRTDLIKKLPKSTESYAVMVELLVYALASGATFVEVPFYRIERSTGKSKALRLKNITGILKTYVCLFWRVRILKRRA